MELNYNYLQVTKPFTVATIGKVAIITKIYVWSVITEPLIYFALASGGKTTGVPLTLSRIFQLIVIFSIFFDLVKKSLPSIKKITNSIRINKYFLFYVIILIVSSTISLFILNSYNLNLKESSYLSQDNTPFLKGKFIRPFFDFFLLIYYYLYFTKLPIYYIKTERDFSYLIQSILRTFYFALFIGFVDLLASLVLGRSLISRHIDENVDVGFRFHSFAGEPRDAFVYVCFGLAVALLSSTIFRKNTVSKKLILTVFTALILTQSASGIVGVFIGGVIGLIYFLVNRNKLAFHFFLVFLVVLGIIYFVIPYSPRMLTYIDAFGFLYDTLSTGSELPILLKVQSVNFLPFWGMYNQILQFNLFPFLFGSGFSSSAYFNMNYYGDSNFSNPNAQITRVLYESGVVGFLYYITFLVKPVIKLFKTFPKSIRYLNFFALFLLIGASLGHRSLTPFIFVGIIFCYNNIYKKVGDNN